MPYVRFVFPVAVLAAVSLALPAVAAAASSKSSGGDPLVRETSKARKSLWRWQDVMQRNRTVPRHSGQELKTKSTVFKKRSLALWERRAERAKRKAKNPPHEREFMCIHSYEGAWTANTGNGYYGGLQMDRSFQRAYGPRLLSKKGLAHNWTPLEQIWVGERALRAGRGFYPWPNAARRCGLI